MWLLGSSSLSLVKEGAASERFPSFPWLYISNQDIVLALCARIWRAICQKAGYKFFILNTEICDIIRKLQFQKYWLRNLSSLSKNFLFIWSTQSEARPQLEFEEITSTLNVCFVFITFRKGISLMGMQNTTLSQTSKESLQDSKFLPSFSEYSFHFCFAILSWNSHCSYHNSEKESNSESYSSDGGMIYHSTI